MECRWMVSELVDPRDSTLPRYVIAHRQGEAPWLTLQEVADKLPGKLAQWLRALAADGIRPVAQPLLGHGCALSEKTAHAVCRFRISQITAMSGCASGAWPDFLLNEKPVNVGARGRPCAVFDGKHVQVFSSIAEAGRHLGIARETVGRAVREGRRCGGGRIVVYQERA